MELSTIQMLCAPPILQKVPPSGIYDQVQGFVQRLQIPVMVNRLRQKTQVKLIDFSKWKEFDNFASEYTDRIYDKHSFSNEKFPHEAAIIVSMLSFVTFYQNDAAYFEIARVFCSNSIEYNIIYHILIHIFHTYCKYFALYPHDTDYIDPIFSKSLTNRGVEFQFTPKYPKISIPSLLFQILYYLYYYQRACELTFYHHSNLNDDQKQYLIANSRILRDDWIVQYYFKFFKVYRNYVLSNKLNKYELYLKKYFQSQFDISFLLMTSMQHIICYSLVTRNPTPLGINCFQLQMNLFLDLISKRYCFLGKLNGYSSLVRYDFISYLHQTLYRSHVWFDVEKLRKKQQRTAARRLRCAEDYYRKKCVINWFDNDLNQRYRNIFYSYYQSIKVSIDMICKKYSPDNLHISMHDKCCKYVKRFILKPSLKAEKMLSKMTNVTHLMDHVIDINEAIVFCYFLFDNDKQCRINLYKRFLYVLMQQHNLNYQQAVLKEQSLNMSEIIPIYLSMQELGIALDGVLTAFGIGRNLKFKSWSKRQQKAFHDKFFGVRRKYNRLEAFLMYISALQAKHSYQARIGGMIEKKYNFVFNVISQLKQNRNDNYYKYQGWKNLVMQKQCEYCFTKHKVLLKCKYCKKVCYCSKQCQKKHWKKIHNKECSKFATGLESDSIMVDYLMLHPL